MNLHDFMARIQKSEPIPGIRVFLDHRENTNYVHAAISIEAGHSRFTGDNRALPMMLPHMLEEGTTTRSRDQVRNELEQLGSEVHFDVTTEHMYVRLEGRADSMTKTLEVVADMITNPLLSESSLTSVASRLISEYEEEKENTRLLAYAAASRALLEDSSALRVSTPEEKINGVNRITHEVLVNHARSVLQGPIVISVVGDISISALNEAIVNNFRKWNSTASSVPVLQVKPRAITGPSEFIRVHGKENCDVYLLATTTIRSMDDAYVPLSVANELLGSSGFTGHLMKTVRERDGLTYGIYSRLRDTASRLPLLIAISATFGSSLYEKGLDVTRKEIATWLNKHITKSNLEKKKIEIVGSYMVSLQDPEDVASQIVAAVSSGKGLQYIADYPDKVQLLGVSEVKNIASNFFNIDRFVVGSSGDTST